MRILAFSILSIFTMITPAQEDQWRSDVVKKQNHRDKNREYRSTDTAISIWKFCRRQSCYHHPQTDLYHGRFLCG